MEHKDAAEPSVGKRTLVEQARIAGAGAGGGGEHEEPVHGFAGVLAAAGKLAINAVKLVLEANADELSKYTNHGAEQAKHSLHHILATCGPDTPHVEARVQVEIDKITNFSFARMMRQAAVQARHMTHASSEFIKELKEHEHGALESFIQKAMLSAKELAQELDEFSKDTREVDDVVQKIRAKCKHEVPVAIPRDLKPRLTDEPLYKFYVNPKLSKDPRTIELNALKLPGGHTALPRGLAIPNGALLGAYLG